MVSARTGIPVDTLRVWERRYGVPRPARREGGSRVYTEEDIARLQVLAGAVALGFRPGDVVALPVAEVEALVRATKRDQSAKREPSVATEVVAPEPHEDALGAAVALLRADDVNGLRGLLRSLAVTFGPRRFVTDFAHPLAVRVGELWAAGELQVRHEHLASASLSTQLRLLLGGLEGAEQPPVVVLTTLPGEPHSLGLEMISVYLATLGGAPRLLGPDTPPEQIAEAARAMNADAVGIGVSPVADPVSTSDHARRLIALLPPTCALWVGGSGAPNLTIRSRRVRCVSTWRELDAVVEAARSPHAA